MRWLAPLRRMRLARWRVGTMFSRRFVRLIRSQSPSAKSDGFALRQGRVAAEIGERIAERRVPEPQEAVKIPAMQVVLVGIEIDREVEIVRHVGNGRAVARQAGRLEHVQTLDNEDVRPIDHCHLAGNDVVDEVRIERRRHLAPSRP